MEMNMEACDVSYRNLHYSVKCESSDSPQHKLIYASKSSSEKPLPNKTDWSNLTNMIPTQVYALRKKESNDLSKIKVEKPVSVLAGDSEKQSEDTTYVKTYNHEWNDRSIEIMKRKPGILSQIIDLLHIPPVKHSTNRESSNPTIAKFDATDPKIPKSSELDSQSSENEIKKNSIEPWTQPFPLEDKGYVPVIVQCENSDCKQTAWVMLQTNETARNNHVREINIDASYAAIPNISEIKVNELFRVPFEGKYYRGVILKIMSDLPFVLALLIDYGNEIHVPISKLKPAIPIMKTLNAFAFVIQFETPREVSIGDTLNVKVKSTKDNVMTVIVEGELSKVTMSDIEIMPIPVNMKLYLYCSDFTNIKDGYISCCVYDSESIILLENVGAVITKFCKRSADSSYRPEIDELFLALFEDGEWYRAVITEEVDANLFDIMSIDYGHRATVNISNIRKIPEELKQNCLMNKCYIKGFPQDPSHSDIKRFNQYFDLNPIFSANVAMEEGKYVLYLSDSKLKV